MRGLDPVELDVLRFIVGPPDQRICDPAWEAARNRLVERGCITTHATIECDRGCCVRHTLFTTPLGDLALRLHNARPNLPIDHPIDP